MQSDPLANLNCIDKLPNFHDYASNLVTESYGQEEDFASLQEFEDSRSEADGSHFHNDVLKPSFREIDGFQSGLFVAVMSPQGQHLSRRLYIAARA